MRLRSVSLLLLVCLACDGGEGTPEPAKGAEGEAGPSTEDAAKPETPTSAFTEYQRKSMRSEAMVNGRMIVDLLRTRLVVDEAAPSSIPATPPPGSCCKLPEGLCPKDMGAWEDPGWKGLGFQPRDAHRYSYQVDVEGSKVSVTASADLDCDGTLSTFTYEGTLAGEELEFATDAPVETNALD